MTTGQYLLACFVAVLVAQTCSAGGCSPYWTYYEGNCYRVFGGPNTWAEANLKCRQLGSELASVHSAGENVFLYTLWDSTKRVPPPGTRMFWLGLNDIESEGNYVYTDGTPFDFGHNQWGPGQPDNAQGNEDCIEVYNNDFEWNDLACTRTLSFICKQAAPCH